MGTITGVYCIENKIDGKKYIGQSKNIEDRIYRHFNSLRKHKHHNERLQSSFDVYGEEAFTWYVLEECNKDELPEKEVKWIEYYDSIYNGYNIMLGGGHTTEWDPPDEYREKIRAMVTGGK